VTWNLTVTCDGTRPNGPCRGALNTRSTSKGDAVAEAVRAGWRLPFAGPDLCPSGGHLEDEHQ
jgi:hypothetical protein